VSIKTFRLIMIHRYKFKSSHLIKGLKYVGNRHYKFIRYIIYLL